MVVYLKIDMDNQEEILDVLNGQFYVFVLFEFSFFNIFIEFILFIDFEKKKGEIFLVLEQYLKIIVKIGEML